MGYFLYLKKSILRTPKRHLPLLLIMIFSFVLPFLFAIYLDSSNYGRKLQLLSESQGETFHIEGVTENDSIRFDNISGLSSPVYKNGIIYIHILDDSEWQSFEIVNAYGNQLANLIGENEKINIRAFQYDYGHGIPEVEERKAQKIVWCFMVFVMLITAYIIQSAYKSHLNQFWTDIGILKGCGANTSQIVKLFMLEYVVIYTIAAVLSFTFSAGFMKGLFMTYLEISEIDGLAWVIFHVNWFNTVILLAVYGIVIFLALYRTLRRVCSNSTQELVGKNNSNNIFRKQRLYSPHFYKKPEKMLCRLWTQRCGKVYRESFLISVSIISIFLFLLCYLVADSQVIETSKEYEIRFGKKVDLYGGFTQAEVDYIYMMENVADIQLHQEQLADVYAHSDEADVLHVDTIWIKLENRQKHAEVTKQLAEIFPEPVFSIYDSENKVDYARGVSKGIYIMLEYIFCSVFMFVMIIIGVKLSDYVECCKTNIYILLNIGATEQMISNSFIIQTIKSGLQTIIFSFLLSISAAMLVLSSLDIAITIEFKMIVAYLISAVAIMGTYVLPVKRSMRRVMRKRY